MGIQEVLAAPRSPWQRAYVERVIGTIRRECLDHVIVFNEASLYQHMKSFLEYYHTSRTHLSLAKDPPEPWSPERWLPFRRWAVFTTAMSGAQPEGVVPRCNFYPGCVPMLAATTATNFFSVRQSRSLISLAS